MASIDELLAQAAASNGVPSESGGTQNPLMVFLGTNPAPDRGPAMHADVTAPAGPSDRGPAMHYDPPRTPWQELRKPYVADRTVGAEAAANMIYSWSAKERKKWEEVLLDAGLIQPGNYNFADLVQLWQGAVEGAGQLYTIGGKKVTPQQYVKNFLGVNGVGGSGGSQTQTNTQKSIVHFDDLDAQGAAMDVYSSLLGRAATDDEASALKAALNAYAKEHPSITTQTTTTDAAGNTTTTSKSRGGVSEQGVGELARETVQSKPEYASYQAAGTYFPILEQMMGGAGLDREF